MSAVPSFVDGLIAMGFAVGGLFFLRFWRSTGDRLFAAFAAAFGLLALQQALIALLGVVQEDHNWTFLLRLAAFTLIIIAVALKNLARPDRGRAARIVNPGGMERSTDQ
jgi:hypothetical protein